MSSKFRHPCADSKCEFLLRVALVAITACAPTVWAQTNPNTDNWIRPFAANDKNSIDTVDVATGVLSVDIPLVSYPQRGGLPPVVTKIHYASKGFSILDHCVQSVEGSEPYCEPHWASNQQFTAPFGVFTVTDNGTVGVFPTLLQKSVNGDVYRFTAHTADGSAHPLFQSGFNSGFLSGDGTGYYCSGCNDTNAARNAVYDRNGVASLSASQYTDSQGNIVMLEDAQGNYESTTIAETTGIDSLGRPWPQAAYTSDTTGCSGDLPTASVQIQTVPAYGGGTTQIKTCSASLEGATAFNDSTYIDSLGNSSPWQSGATVVESTPASSVVQTVLLYDGNSWSTSPKWVFHYNNGQNGSGVVNYGDLTQIDLPTGGTIQYTYGTRSICSAIPYSGYVNMSRVITSRTENAGDGSPAVTKTYTATTVNDGVNDTVHTFTGIGNSCSLYDTQVSYYSGSGSNRELLKTVKTDYSYSLDPYGTYYNDGATRVINVLPIRVTTTLPNGLVTKVESDYQTSTGSSHGNTYAISTGKVTQKREYDWGNGSSGSLLRCTATTYQTQQNSAYFNSNLLDIPAIVSVYSGACGSGTLMSQTTLGYDEKSLQSSGITAQRDPKAPSLTVRGNLTSTHKWLNTTGGTVNESYSYYDTGEMYQYADAKNNPPTTYSYGSAYQGAYLTQTQLPTTGGIAHIVSAGYDFNTGLVTSFTDQNSRQSIYAYDNLERLLTASFPDGGSVKLTYPSFIQVIQTVALSSSSSEVTTSNFDGLGRPVGTILSEGNGSNIYTRTAYDAQGRSFEMWNPSRCDQRTQSSCAGETTWGVTSFTYDALGRKVIQTQPDGSKQQWCYDNQVLYGQSICLANRSALTGNWVDYADEAGNHWQRISDGLGRLTSVMEPNPSTNVPSIETDYTYDALSNLTRVDQWGGARGSSGERARTFTYDSLSRPISSSNPETGSICFGTLSGSTCKESYDSNGNLITRTDARGVLTNNTYDALNRLTSKSYSNDPTNTPSLTFVYDTATGWGFPAESDPTWDAPVQQNLVGRLSLEYNTPVGDSTSSTAYSTALNSFSYDPMGRALFKESCDPHTCGPSNGNDIEIQHFAYDLAGHVTFFDRGMDMRKNANSPDQGYYYGGFNQAYDTAGRLASETTDGLDDLGGNTATPYILLNATYYPTGQMASSSRLGDNTETVYHTVTKTYNNRGWYTGQSIVDWASQQIWNSSTTYYANGSVKASTDRYAGDWSYTYDHLNRIATATGPNGVLSYIIDSFGNKTQQKGISGPGPFPQPDYGTATTDNRLPGISYDAAGDVLADGSHTYTYDAENRLHSVDGSTFYVYAPDGDRVAETNSQGGPTASFLYDTNHRLMTQINTGTSKLVRANIYAGSDFMAEDSPDPFQTNTATSSQLRITDQAGSLRSLWDMSANWTGAWTSFPYGDGAAAGDGADSQDNPGGMLFTGKERDAESGLDYFGARYYASNMGRFMSPDWAAQAEPVPYAKLDDPQSLNLYSYVRNNPLSEVDVDGHSAATDADAAACAGANASGNYCASSQPNLGADQDRKLMASQQQQAQQQNGQQTEQPATPNPNGSVPPPPPGKGPGWKPGDPLTPNEWVSGQGSDGRPVRWNPKYPIPGQSPPNTSWDAPNGHWDNPDGRGNTTRWLPNGGGPVDHDNNPLRSAWAWAGEHKGALITGAVVVGVGAAIIFSGGAAAPAAALILVAP